jgi:hypothetical protein
MGCNLRSVQEHWTICPVKPIACDLCPEKFNNKTDVRRHKVRDHGLVDKNLVECEICKKLMDRSNIKLHYDTHSANKRVRDDEPIVQCHVCGYAHYPDVVRSHMRIYERDGVYESSKK